MANGKWQNQKSAKNLSKIEQKSFQNRPKINPKSVLELQISVMEPAPLPEPCWIDFEWILLVLLAQLGAILGGKLGPCWNPKLIFTGVGRRLKMSTKLKSLAVITPLPLPSGFFKIHFFNPKMGLEMKPFAGNSFYMQLILHRMDSTRRFSRTIFM